MEQSLESEWDAIQKAISSHPLNEQEILRRYEKIINEAKNPFAKRRYIRQAKEYLRGCEYRKNMPPPPQVDIKKEPSTLHNIGQLIGLILCVLFALFFFFVVMRNVHLPSPR